MADVLTREAVAGCVDRAPAGELYEFVAADLAASHETLRDRLRELVDACTVRDRKDEEYRVNPTDETGLALAKARRQYAKALRRAQAEAGTETSDA